MLALRAKLVRDEGWTFIEATLAVVIMSIMVLGLTIVLLAFREHLDRSWAVRAMDQYGNDVVENLAHDLRNAVDVVVRPGPGNTNNIDIKFLNPYSHDRFEWSYWKADMRNGCITVNNRPLQPFFPPRNMKRGESYAIEQFTLSGYGEKTPNSWEHDDKFRRSKKFNEAALDIRFKIRYYRNAIYTNERNWSYGREYYNRVYMRNKNLIVKKGITE
ncbi:MAG: hypothetical protein FJY65_08025 [Calditrichaeota bacterium]|nr:hypothetical protein [Calditrichota bacterium]